MQDNSFQKYATNYPDIFTDLTDSGIDFSEFSSAKVAYSTLDGKNYGIPFDNGAVIECLRTDMLEEAGFTEIKTYGDQSFAPVKGGEDRIYFTARKRD